MLCSTCISGGLLTSIYDRGRHERLHGPLSILSFALSIAIYQATRAPLDILVFVIFPWVLAGGLLASRAYSPIIRTDHNFALEFGSRKEGKCHPIPGKQRLGLTVGLFCVTVGNVLRVAKGTLTSVDRLGSRCGMPYIGFVPSRINLMEIEF